MTAPATPTATALDVLGDCVAVTYDAGKDIDVGLSALATVRALVEAALEFTAWRPIPSHPGSQRLKHAVDAYRNWHPAPATVTSGDSGGSGQ